MRERKISHNFSLQILLPVLTPGLPHTGPSSTLHIRYHVIGAKAQLQGKWEVEPFFVEKIMFGNFRGSFKKESAGFLFLIERNLAFVNLLIRPGRSSVKARLQVNF
jgi:hypothetical protein